MVLGAWAAADLICLSIGVHAYVAPARRGGMGGRTLLSQSTPRAPAQETREAYLSRLRAACAHVNDNFDVAGLNRELPDRVQKLQELQGDKLRK